MAAGFVEDLKLGFRRPPNLVWSGRPRSDMARAWNLPMRSPSRITFTTDSLGFRNRSELDQADIALIGDSYIEGQYVSDEDTVATVLGKLTAQAVVNLGQAGYGTLQELEVFRRYALPKRPDLVVWFFFEGNDFYNDQDFENTLLYVRKHGTLKPQNRGAKKRQSFRWNRFLKISLTTQVFRLLRRQFHFIVPNGVRTFGWFRDSLDRHHRMYFWGYASLPFSEYEENQFAKTQEALLTAQRLCNEHSIQLLVSFIPMKFRVYGDYCSYPPYSPCTTWKPWDPHARFAKFCTQAGIRFLDLTIPMRRMAATGKLLYAPEDSHWNREGHRFVAEVLRQHSQ